VAQLAARPLLPAHRRAGDLREVRDGELRAGVDAATLAAQVLAVEQGGAGHVQRPFGGRVQAERLPVQPIRVLAVAQQRPRAGGERTDHPRAG
jgi:hypothetical protein